MLLNDRQETPEGLEVSFATNTVGTYLLTELMLPVLRKSSPARVVCGFAAVYARLRKVGHAQGAG